MVTKEISDTDSDNEGSSMPKIASTTLSSKKVTKLEYMQVETSLSLVNFLLSLGE